MKFSTKIRQSLKYLVFVYLLGISVFFIFRLILFLLHIDQFNAIEGPRQGMLMRAFIMGWRFDTVISCYILFFPVLILSCFIAFRNFNTRVLKICYIFFFVLFSVSFLISCVDIPFYSQFSTRLNDSFFVWFEDYKFVAKMLFSEKTFFVYFFVFLAFIFCYGYFLKKIYQKNKNVFLSPTESVGEKNYRYLFVYIPLSILFCGLIFLGIRGRISKKSPIHSGLAFFSSNMFINQLGLNPVFTLFQSMEESAKPENARFDLISTDEAMLLCGSDLKADTAFSDQSPIARVARIDSLFQGRNLVLVIMESMAASKMQRFGNNSNLTPFLDSLASESWTFDNIYTAGIHTHNGIFSTLFAHPAFFAKHSMRTIKPIKMSGLPNHLAASGYQTVFFIPHDEAFDNVAGFLSNNDFQRIFGQKDYPRSEVKSTLGVTDHFMFDFSIPVLNRMSENKMPFFATFMTASDHQPFIIPDNQGFTPRNKEERKQIVEYADWSLQEFIKSASQQSWYQNTVFVFIADHGLVFEADNHYDLQLPYHHTPFVIFAPGITEPKVYNQMGLQLDVFPTVMSRLGIPYINNTFGIDLLTEEHDYIVFSSDNVLGCMSDSLLYIYRKYSPDGIYEYKDFSTENKKDNYPKQAEIMKKQAFSWLELSRWMIENDKTSMVKSK